MGWQRHYAIACAGVSPTMLRLFTWYSREGVSTNWALAAHCFRKAEVRKAGVENSRSCVGLVEALCVE